MKLFGQLEWNDVMKLNKKEQLIIKQSKFIYHNHNHKHNILIKF